MGMGKPVGKASACLREAASAKAGPNFLIEKHGQPCPLRGKEVLYSASFL
jgi:hypothetical protein